MGLHIIKSARKWAATYWYKEMLYYHELYLKADNHGQYAEGSEYWERYLWAKYKYEKYKENLK